MKRNSPLLLIAISCFALATVLVAQGPLTPLFQLRGKTDSAGYLIATAGAYTAPESPLTAFGNLRGRVDSSGYLMVTLGPSAQTLGGNLLFSPDNTYDIGTNGGGGRPRDVNVGRSIIVGTSIAVGTSPATTGVLQIPNGNTNFMARNGANGADISLINLSSTDVVRIGQSTATGVALQPPLLTLATVLFAALGTPANGNLAYCSDCTLANPCAGSGTGALAKRLNSVWVCN